MNSQLIIVPNEELVSGGIWSKNIIDSDRHGKRIEEYSNLHQLGLNFQNVGVDNYNGYFWGVALAKLGHISLHTDDNLIIYLPDYISEGQYQFFQKHKKFIQKFGNRVFACFIILVDDIYQIKELEVDLEQEFPISSVELFYQELKEKYRKQNMKSNNFNSKG